MSKAEYKIGYTCIISELHLFIPWTDIWVTYYVQKTAIGPWIIMASETENTDLTEIKTCIIQGDKNWTEGYVKVIKLSVFKTVNNFFSHNHHIVF